VGWGGNKLREILFQQVKQDRQISSSKKFVFTRILIPEKIIRSGQEENRRNRNLRIPQMGQQFYQRVFDK